MKIRTTSPSDLDAIVEVFRACWTLSYADLLPLQVREEMSEDKARDMWRGAVEPHADRSTLLADIDGKVVGVARIGSDPNDQTRGHLFSLYVHPDFAGRGIGRALLTEAMSQLHDRGFALRTLWVFKDNESAQGLYKSFGFMPTGEEKTDPRWQIPEIEMILN